MPKHRIPKSVLSAYLTEKPRTIQDLPGQTILPGMNPGGEQFDLFKPIEIPEVTNDLFCSDETISRIIASGHKVTRITAEFPD